MGASAPLLASPLLLSFILKYVCALMSSQFSLKYLAMGYFVEYYFSGFLVSGCFFLYQTPTLHVLGGDYHVWQRIIFLKRWSTTFDILKRNKISTLSPVPSFHIIYRAKSVIRRLIPSLCILVIHFFYILHHNNLWIIKGKWNPCNHIYKLM